MDDIQIILKNAASLIVASLDNRPRLKSVLSDCLHGKKLQLNLLLNAYDNGCVTIIQNSDSTSDKELFIQRLVQSLTSDYGITAQAAIWTIETWSLIIESASPITSSSSDTNLSSSSNINLALTQYESFLKLTLKESTVKNYLSEINKFIKHENIVFVKDIDSDKVNDYIENGVDGYINSMTSLKRRRSIFIRFLEFLADSGLLQPSLCKDYIKDKDAEEQLRQEEEERLKREEEERLKREEE